jgi:hypothetical protein
LASFARHESAQEAETPEMIYSALLGQVHRRLAVGLHSAWIDRRSGVPGSGATPPPPEGVRWDFRFAGMAELVEAHRDELRS